MAGHYLTEDSRLMTTHPYDELTLPHGGKLIFTPCPGTKGVGVAASVEQLQQAGAVAVISMTSNSELGKLDVSTLPETITQAGIRWFQLPVEDDARPDSAFEQAWAASRDEIMSLVLQHKAIAIHCRGGSGRTGFMAALILREMGMDGAEADELVKGLRPHALKLAVHTEYLAARDAHQPRNSNHSDHQPINRR
jgi:protein-tyrosine phosphatase